MKQACTIILVRHGESVNNKQHIVAGDSPLTDLGKQQARQTKQALAGLHFDAVYSSDFQRAVETAKIISGKTVPKSHRLPGLRERDFGSLDGKATKHHVIEHAKRLTLTNTENWTYKYVPDMESDHELSSRFLAALQEIAENNSGKTILVSAHGAIIRTTLMKVHGLTYKQAPNDSFKNGGYVELAYANNTFRVVQIVGLQI